VSAVVFPSEEADAVKPGKRDKGIYNTAYDAFHAAENYGDKVKSEKPDKTPVDRTKYY